MRISEKIKIKKVNVKFGVLTFFEEIIEKKKMEKIVINNNDNHSL